MPDWNSEDLWRRTRELIEGAVSPHWGTEEAYTPHFTNHRIVWKGYSQGRVFMADIPSVVWRLSVFTSALHASLVCVDSHCCRAEKRSWGTLGVSKPFFSRLWGPGSYGALVVIVECVSNSGPVKGEPGLCVSRQPVPAECSRQPMENHFLVKSASYCSTNGKN